MRLRLPGVLLLWVVMGALSAGAAEERRDGYRMRSEEGEHGVPAKLLAPDGRQVASVDTLYAAHHHAFAVREGRLFWVSRPRGLSPGWTDELRVTELAGGKTRTLFRQPGLDFRVDARGLTAAVVGCDEAGACTLHTVDVASGRARPAHASDSALYPLGLSRDGARVWFGKADGPAGEWVQLGLYEKERVRFFPIAQGEDQALDFDTGRVAQALPCASDDCERERRKRGGEVLVVEDVLAGQRAEVARRKRGAFKPAWNADGSLSYVDAQGRKARYVPSSRAP